MAEKRGRGEAPAESKFAEWVSPYEVNRLTVPPELVEEITEQGLVYRWINAKMFIERGHRHRDGWVPYQRESGPDLAGQFTLNVPVGADGYIRNEDLVLAVRPDWLNEQHKQKIKEKNKKNQEFSKGAADRLRGEAASAGINPASIIDEY